MRTRRLKAPPDAPSGFYHCISRVVDRRLVLGDTEKEHFCRLLRSYAHFCGLQILTFCVMGNHFHLLIEVPRRPESPPEDEELLERIAAIHSPHQTRIIRDLLAKAPPMDREAIRERFWRRMGDISQFLKELKQRFSQWHNRRQGRRGTLWEERIKSVLIGADGPALSTIAAYIDLNPLRAGLVSNPASYRWSGYGEAMSGLSRALDGYRRLVAVREGSTLGPSEALKRYREGLFDYAERRGITPIFRRGWKPADVDGGDSSSQKPSSNRHRVMPVHQAHPSSPIERLLRRIRHFSDGMAIGTRGFIESIALHRRARLQPRRTVLPHPIEELADDSLFSLRRTRAMAFD